MASFIAKQLIGNQLDSVKGMVDKKDGGDDSGGSKEVDPEVEAALREAEEKRQEKHRKMEEEREFMRQEIRDKYGLKKKENAAAPGGTMEDINAPEGRLGRKRKTPAELEAEAAAAEEEENSIVGFIPKNIRDMASKATETPRQIVSDAGDKCSLM